MVPGGKQGELRTNYGDRYVFGAAPVESDDSATHRKRCRFEPTGNAELGKDAGRMRGHGPAANEESVGNLIVGSSLDKEPEHL